MDDKRKVKKQLIVDPELYRRLKSKLALDDITISTWLENKMREEVENGRQA